MRHLALLVLAGLAALVAVAASAAAQSPELRAAHARVIQLYASGHNVEAAVVAGQALELGIDEFGPEHPSTAALMANLAKLHGELGQWPEAEALYRRAAAVRSRTLGTSHPDTGEAYAGLGQALAEQALYVEAEESYWQALAALGVEVARNPHMIDELSLRAALYRARAIYNRAHQFVAEARLDEAELLYRSAIAVFESNGTVERGAIVAALGKRVAVLRALGRDDEAARIEAHAVAVLRGRASCPAGLFTTC